MAGAVGLSLAVVLGLADLARAADATPPTADAAVPAAEPDAAASPDAPAPSEMAGPPGSVEAEEAPGVVTVPLPPAEAKPVRRRWVDEVVVTALREEAEAFAAPYLVTTVDLDSFSQRRLYRTLPEALREEPGVMVQKTGHGQGSPYLRGFTGFRTLLLVDGVRVNNSVFRDGPNEYWALVDPYVLDRLEVVRGPSSVLFGSDAIGGTVNAITRRREQYGPGVDWDRTVFYRVSSAECSNVLRVETSGNVGEQFGWLAGGSLKDYGDLHAGGGTGRQERTAYEECGGDVKLEYFPSRDEAITFAHYALVQDGAWRTHTTVYGESWEGTTVGNELRRVLDHEHTLTYARYRRENLGGPIDAIDITLSHQYLSEEQYRIKADLTRDKQGFDVNTYGVGVQLESGSPIGYWTYGVEWYHDEVDSFLRKYRADGSLGSVSIQGPVADDASYDLLGAYVQDRIPLHEQLDVILGARFTYARADAHSVQSPTTGERISITEDWCNVVSSARFSWFLDPEEHWNVFGGVSQGFRAPNLSDLTRFDTARSNEIETPSPDVEPEKYISYEIGAKVAYDRFAVAAAYYFTDIRDMIVRAPTGAIINGDREVTKRNAGDGYVHGVECTAEYRLHPEWTVFGSFAWVYGEVDTYPTSDPVTRREPLTRLAPPTTQLGLRWDHPEERFWAEALWTIACDADNLSSGDKRDTQRIPRGGTPGYQTLDLRGGWRVNENLDLWAGIENVTNTNYRVHGSGLNAPGISFLMGAKWRF